MPETYEAVERERDRLRIERLQIQNEARELRGHKGPMVELVNDVLGFIIKLADMDDGE